MIENIKARIFGKKFNIWTEKEDKNRPNDEFLGGYYIYNDTIYYGWRLFVYFKSNQNSWFNNQ